MIRRQLLRQRRRHHQQLIPLHRTHIHHTRIIVETAPNARTPAFMRQPLFSGDSVRLDIDRIVVRITLGAMARPEECDLDRLSRGSSTSDIVRPNH
jgi:hypothetical protein